MTVFGQMRRPSSGVVEMKDGGEIVGRRLYIIEGLPCSGKSTLSSFAASELQRWGKEKVCFVDEGTGNHPADWENHAYAPAGLVSEKAEIVPLSRYSGDLLARLLPFKIYDALPWEQEKPLMLEKWRQFVSEADPGSVYVFNCVLLQNPMCETMMRFGFQEAVSLAYIQEIVGVISAMDPAVIYLKNDDISASIRKAAQERAGWLDAVIAYHVQGEYGKRIHARGFDGYIACLQERQQRELRMLDQLPIQKLVLDNPQRDWLSARRDVCAFLRETDEG